MSGKPIRKMVIFDPSEAEQALFAQAEEAVAQDSELADFNDLCKRAIASYLTGEDTASQPQTALSATSIESMAAAMSAKLEPVLNEFRQCVSALQGDLVAQTANSNEKQQQLASELEKAVAHQTGLEEQMAELIAMTHKTQAEVSALAEHFTAAWTALQERLPTLQALAETGKGLQSSDSQPQASQQKSQAEPLDIPVTESDNTTNTTQQLPDNDRELSDNDSHDPVLSRIGRAIRRQGEF